jgi:hypothetical protein
VGEPLLQQVERDFLFLFLFFCGATSLGFPRNGIRGKDWYFSPLCPAGYVAEELKPQPEKIWHPEEMRLRTVCGTHDLDVALRPERALP